MKPGILIWGAGGHGSVVADILRLRGEFEIKAFLEEGAEPGARQFLGIAVLPPDPESIRKLNATHLIVAFGNCRRRLECADWATRAGLQLATAVHPRATIAATAQIGPGCVIAANAVVNPGATVGANVIINTSASIDHDCTIEPGAHLAPGCILAGNVTVGRATHVGAGATVINRIRIGSRSYIGAGAVVVENVPDDVLAYGVPARIIRKITSHEF